jgi:hypothetical protein
VESGNLDDLESIRRNIEVKDHLEAFVREMVHYLTVMIKMAETTMLQRAI